MADEQLIKPRELPAATTVFADDAIMTDNGSIVGKATPVQIVNAGAPVPTEAEAIAGADNSKRMTPLTVKQVLDSVTAPSVMRAAAWAESDSPPDPGIPGSQSAKSWAAEAERLGREQADRAEAAAADAAIYGPVVYPDYTSLSTDPAISSKVGRVAQIMGGSAVSIVPVDSGDYNLAGAGVVTIPDRDNFWVSLGAWGVKTGDDITVPLRAALAKYLHVSIPAGTYYISETVHMSRQYGSLVGAGMGVTILKPAVSNIVMLQVGAATNITPIPHRLRLADLSLDGLNISRNLLFRLVAESIVERIESFYSTSDGIEAEIAINSVIRDCSCRFNAADGINVRDGVSGGTPTETRSGATMLLRNTCNLNGRAGMSVTRCYGIQIIGGDCSVNEHGVLLDGGGRCTVSGVWLENNLVSWVTVRSSTSPGGVVYSGDANTIENNVLSGTNSPVINIESGAQNTLQNNFLSPNGIFNISAACTRTTVEHQAWGPSTINDSGNGSILRSSPLNQTYKVGGFERFKLVIGSLVDMSSNASNIRIAGLRGLSQNISPSNNLRGSAALGASDTFVDVTFTNAEPSAGYTVTLTPRVVSGSPTISAFWVSNQTVNGFRINMAAAPGASGVQMHWQLIG